MERNKEAFRGLGRGSGLENTMQRDWIDLNTAMKMLGVGYSDIIELNRIGKIRFLRVSKGYQVAGKPAAKEMVSVADCHAYLIEKQNERSRNSDCRTADRSQNAL